MHPVHDAMSWLVWLGLALSWLPTPTLGQLGQAPDSTRYSSTGAELVEPEVVQSSGGSLDLTLEFGRWTYTGPDGRAINTRAYAGRLPGPTIRFSRGDTVRIKLVNTLTSSCSSGTINTIRDYCITNLHTHGLHVASSNPADDVFLAVGPGESFQHEYAIPANHIGGTHWYHPHHHGSAALTVLGGASGMIIVEDDDADGLPSEFRGMPEKLMFMTILNSDLSSAEAMAGGSWATTAPTTALLINGQTKPKLSIAADKWLRLRFALSAVEHTVSVTVPNSCEAMLLAKDGVWLPGGARTITKLHFAPGNRVDVAMRCSAGTHDVSTDGGTLAAGGRGGGRRLQGGGGGGGGGAVGGGIQSYPTQMIASIAATSQGDTATALPTLIVNFPAYLPDLRNVQIANQMNRISLQGGRGCQFTCGAYGHDTVTEFIQLGETHQWTVSAAGHPLHVHINHLQLSTVSADPFGDNWHQVGDWVDTFLGSGNVRFLADTFTGEVVAHCHLLVHEDQGCMARFHILADASAYSGRTCVNYPVSHSSTPTAAPSPSPSPTASSTPTAAPSPSPSPTASSTPTAAPSPSPSPTASSTPTPAPSPSPSPTSALLPTTDRAPNRLCTLPFALVLEVALALIVWM